MALKLAKTFWRGCRDFNAAWQISNGSIRMTVMQVGGHISQISDDIDGALNPMWQPKWSPEDSSKIPYDGTASLKRGWMMSKKFGGDNDSSLLAGIVGHNLCVDRFGPPHTRMVQQGKLMKEKMEWKPIHGEAGCLPWELKEANDDSICFSVFLPEAKLDINRRFEMDGNEVHMETSVIPSDNTAKEIEWCEHVTIGDPFMDGASVEAHTDGAWMFPEALPLSRFSNTVPLQDVDPGIALAIPTAKDDRCGDIITTRVTEGIFKVSNLGKSLTYTWDKSDFPWLCLWTEHQSRETDPWGGVERARGMEFSSKPFPEGKPPEERASLFHGTSTVCQIPPTGKTTRVKISWK